MKLVGTNLQCAVAEIHAVQGDAGCREEGALLEGEGGEDHAEHDGQDYHAHVEAAGTRGRWLEPVKHDPRKADGSKVAGDGDSQKSV